MPNLRSIAMCLLAGAIGCHDAASPERHLTLSAVSATTQDAIAGNLVSQPPTVIVRDTRGEPIAGVRVAFLPTLGNPPFITITGSDGTAHFSWYPSTKVGLDTVFAVVEGLASVEFVANVRADLPARAIAQSDLEQLGLAGGTVPAPTVRVTDRYGNPTSGVSVSFVLAGPAAATIVNATAITDSTGTVTAGAWTLGSAAGEYTLTTNIPNTSIPPLVFHARINAPFVVSAIAAGGTATCAIAASGETYCWGHYLGAAGQAAAIPTRVPNVPPLVSLTVGNGHACGLTSAGAAYCWGGNASGQLGIGTFSENETQAHAVGGGLSFTSLGAGDAFTCGLTTDQLVYCWGDNTLGQLGDVDTNTRVLPKAITSTEHFTTIAAGVQHACAAATTGTTYCWGANDRGQLGAQVAESCEVPSYDYYYGTTYIIVRCSRTPIAVKGAPGPFTTLTASDGSCGLLSSGQPYCWGFPGSGAVVNGALFTSLVSTIGGEVCGITVTQSISCWAYVDSYTTIMTAVPGIVAPKRVVAGNEHWCAIDSTGTAYCWGNNIDGELGNGTRTFSKTPLLVAAP